MKIEKGINNPILKKIFTINIVITSGLLLALIVVTIKQVLGIPVKPILSDMVKFSDFFDVLKFSAGKFGPNATGNYFPFTYIFMRFIEFLSFGNYKKVYFITFTINIITSILFCRMLLKDKIDKKTMYINILIFILFQFPMLFAFQRGNIEILILMFCILFFVLYRNKKYNLASIVLSLAISMKLYPALLAILFLCKKQYKSFLLCAAMSLGLTILSFLLIQDTLGGLSHYLSGFTNFIDIYGKLSGMQYNHSILFGIYYLLYKVFNINLVEIFTSSIMNIYTIIIMCISIALTIYIILKKMQEWKKVTMLTLMIVAFPQISFDYTLILLIIPIMIFIVDENTKNWEEIVYSILFRIIINANEYK